MKHFVCHGSLRQINQSGSSLITDIWRCLVLNTFASTRLWRLKKPHKAIHDPTLRILISMLKNNTADPYSVCQYSLPRPSENTVWDQCVQPEALRCSINSFSQPFKSRGVIDSDSSSVSLMTGFYNRDASMKYTAIQGSFSSQEAAIAHNTRCSLIQWERKNLPEQKNVRFSPNKMWISITISLQNNT